MNEGVDQTNEEDEEDREEVHYHVGHISLLLQLCINVLIRQALQIFIGCTTDIIILVSGPLFRSILRSFDLRDQSTLLIHLPLMNRFVVGVDVIAGHGDLIVRVVELNCDHVRSGG